MHIEMKKSIFGKKGSLKVTRNREGLCLEIWASENPWFFRNPTIGGESLPRIQNVNVPFQMQKS